LQIINTFGFGMLKNFLKDKLLIAKIRSRFAPAVQISQRSLYLQYLDLQKQGRVPAASSTGFRVFSQYEEDGILLFIFAMIGMTNKVFVEIGSDDGINSNAANLYFNFGWHGLFIDGNPISIARGKKFYSKYPHPLFYKPKFLCALLTAENVNELIESEGITGEIGLLSIDIDGNDYWIWHALTTIRPQVVIIETRNEFGTDDLVVPYDADFIPPGAHPLYSGASAAAMVRLAAGKGYRLVAANELGFNLIFVRNDLAVHELPEVPIDMLMQHPSVAADALGFQKIKDWPFIKDGAHT
jgi:hypothetical protein